jgi:uncharacterized tellurite resistance protein B-like protein
MLLDLTIQFAFAVARADGPVRADERDAIRQHFGQRFGYDRALLNRAEALCAHCETAALDLNECVRQINARFAPGHRAALVAFAATVIAASVPPSAAATAFLNEMARRLGVPIAKPAPPPPSPPRATPSPPTPGKITPPPPPAESKTTTRPAARPPEPVAPPRIIEMRVAVSADDLRPNADLDDVFAEPSPPAAAAVPPATPTADPRANPDLDAVFGGM